MSNEETMLYIGTFQGNFVRRVGEGEPNAVTRVNKNGKTVHEVRFNTITGRLTDISEKDSEFGKRWIFVFEAGGQKLSLESSQKGSLATTIINRLPNLDLSNPFKIKIAYNASKDRTMFFVDQDGVNIEDKYQKWDKEKREWIRNSGYPAWEKIIVDGEERYDASKQIAFGKKVVKKYFTDAVIVKEEPMPEDTPMPEAEEEDEIPF